MLNASVLSVDPVQNLQLALGIELAVMPPYLYALWSIKPASEGASKEAEEAANSIRTVVYEEMLHAALVGNLLNALGTRPDVTAHLMSYPGPLPGHTRKRKYAYDVGLGPLSRDTVKTFKRIESPEWKDPASVGPGWITIGAFYDKLKTQLGELDPTAFRHGHQLPPGGNPGPGRLFQVADLTSALKAIETVIDQGEGHRPKRDDEPKAESDDDHEVAHYYQFKTIHGYLSTGSIDPTRDLYPVVENPDATKYSPAQQNANRRFNEAYTELLDSLQAAFNSDEPRAFGTPTDRMAELPQLAAQLRNAGKAGGKVAGPTFEYLGKRGGSG